MENYILLFELFPSIVLDSMGWSCLLGMEQNERYLRVMGSGVNGRDFQLDVHEVGGSRSMFWSRLLPLRCGLCRVAERAFLPAE